LPQARPDNEHVGSDGGRFWRILVAIGETVHRQLRPQWGATAVKRARGDVPAFVAVLQVLLPPDDSKSISRGRDGGVGRKMSGALPAPRWAAARLPVE